MRSVCSSSDNSLYWLTHIKVYYTTMDLAGAKTTALEEKVTSVETALSDHSDILVSLQEDVAQLKKTVVSLESRNEDLESRSRRCNLRITNVKERREHGVGLSVPDYVSKLLMDSLRLEKAPLLDRAHRTLRERPGDHEPARAFVVRCHYFQEREAILKKAIQMKNITTPDGDKIRIQPDYTHRVTKQRAAFNDVRKELRELDIKGIRYGLFHQLS